MTLRFAIFACCLCCFRAQAQEPVVDSANGDSANWPQSSGPNGSWTVDSPQPVPIEFSVRHGTNILWQMELPEYGQSGLTVWEDKIFLSVMKPMLEPKPLGKRTGDTIVAARDEGDCQVSLHVWLQRLNNSCTGHRWQARLVLQRQRSTHLL